MKLVSLRWKYVDPSAGGVTSLNKASIKIRITRRRTNGSKAGCVENAPCLDGKEKKGQENAC
jgi:hypothetical protein